MTRVAAVLKVLKVLNMVKMVKLAKQTPLPQDKRHDEVALKVPKDGTTSTASRHAPSGNLICSRPTGDFHKINIPSKIGNMRHDITIPQDAETN